MDLLKSPWFYKSPSPWSLVFMLILAIYGGRLFYRAGAHYKRWPKLGAFLDGLFLVLVIVLIQDTIWLLFNTARWLPEYGAKMGLDYWLRFGQNGAALIFSFIMISDKYQLYFDFDVRKFGPALLVYMIFLGSVFAFAPDPSLSDWTYAIRFGYSDGRILEAFILSHVLGKALIAWMYISTFWPLKYVEKMLARAEDPPEIGTT